jgi:hypothetical protein
VLFKLTGSACSGKNTLAAGCSGIADLAVHDFDEVGVPSNADACWRQRALEDWIQRALGYQRDGRSLLLTGQSPLGEVLACPSAPLLDGIAVCLIDVDDHERLARLELRDGDRWDECAKLAFLGWAQWHREHAVDPRARPGVITEQGWEQMRWDRWLDWSRDDPRWSTSVISSSRRPVGEVVCDLENWIHHTQRLLETGELPLASGWE